MVFIKFATDNSAFSVSPSDEVARILQDLAKRIERGQTSGRVMDENGNRCGEWSFEND